MAGEGTARATSIDSGRGRARGVRGNAKVRANEAKDGKSEEVDGCFVSLAEAAGVGVAGCGNGSFFSGGVGGGGEGVRGGGKGGRWPSDDSHASLAAFSSRLAKGSNSLRMSLETGAGTDEISEFKFENTDCPKDGESGRVIWASFTPRHSFPFSCGSASFHGFEVVGSSAPTTVIGVTLVSAAVARDPFADNNGDVVLSTSSDKPCVSDGFEPIYSSSICRDRGRRGR